METQPLIAGRYRLERALGRGGQGTAHLALDTASGDHVVLKLLTMGEVSDWAQVELFQRESRVLKTLDHPSIPRCVDSLTAEIGGQHTFVLVQQYIEAPSLQEKVASGWRGTEGEIRGIGARLLGILAYIHGLRPPIVHRDINPKNVLLGADGRVSLVDFGGVQDALRLQGAAGATLIGTPGYAPPEQVLGRATVRSDLYALAVTLVYLLTHRDPAGLPAADLKLDYRALIEVSPPLAAVLDSYLEPDESRRTLAPEQAIALLEGTAMVPAAGDPGKRPYGSRIEVCDDGGVRGLSIPERGAVGQSVVMGGFSTVWLMFIGFWTVSTVAMDAPIVFPLFSIPFWLVGFFLLYKALNSAFGWTDVTLEPGQITVARRLLGFSRAETIPAAEIAACRAMGSACRLDAGAVHLRLGTSLSDSEREWLAGAINAHLDRCRPPR